MLERKSFALLVVVFALGLVTAAEEEAAPKLLGPVTVQQLDADPYAEWSRPNYEEYVPNPAVLAELREAELDGLKLTVFFGTWCGDSRREVPRLLKLIDAMGLPAETLRLVAVDNAKQALKRSPGGEERGLEIYRVATLVVERRGKEIGRLVEHPVLSLERDLLAILAGREYESSYPAYPVVRAWREAGLLADPNVSPWGLAGQVRAMVAGEGDLAAAARVMASRGEKAEALKLLEVNAALFRRSASCQLELAEAWLERGDRERAREAAERALRYNDDPERLGRLTELIRGTAEPTR
jgi:tetratricopeptide (TPR) repeat protein